MTLRTSRRIVALLCFFVIGVGASSAALAHGRDNVVLQWNSALLQAIRNAGFAPIRAARGFAILHTCMYDAWAAYDRVAVGTRFGGSLRRPVRERTIANVKEAMSHAAYRALVDLFPFDSPNDSDDIPDQQVLLFDPLMKSLGYDPSDTTMSASVGAQACAAVLSFRHADGSNQLGDMNGGAPYSDYTGYLPVNTHNEINDPNHWQPLATAVLPDGTVTQQIFLAPHWGRVTPFALTNPDQHRPEPPAQYGTFDYIHEADAVRKLSARLDDRKKATALYWADGPNTEAPPGHWNLIAQWVSRRDRHTLGQDVKMFFALGNALLDVSIAIWECKRTYDYVRPITAIRFLYNGHKILAWGGPGAGTQLIDGANFRSYIPTPPFAEFTSGHSAFSASGAEVLRRFTGSRRFGGSYTVLKGSSFVEPGIAPSVDVRLKWATFEDAADEAGISRRYGGIHFKNGDLSSRRMGRTIGAECWKKALTYFKGTASVP